MFITTRGTRQGAGDWGVHPVILFFCMFLCVLFGILSMVLVFLYPHIAKLKFWSVSMQILVAISGFLFTMPYIYEFIKRAFG
jgi:hypothetical protein